MAIKSTEMASSLKPRVCETERESQEETSDSQTNGRETLVGSIDGLSLDTYLPEFVDVLKEELAAAKQHAARLLEERAEKENVLMGYQQAISQRDTIIQHMANELTSFEVKESVDDLEAIFQQSLAKIERERLEKRELEAVRERKDKDTEKQISELKEAIVLVEQRSEESYTQMTMEVAKKLETGEWITAEDLVKERALIVEMREELERKSSMVSQLEHVLELEKRARVKEIEMFKNLLHNKEDEKMEVENKLHKLKKGVKEQLVQIYEEKSATYSGTWREPQSPESVSNHTGLACGTLGAVREKSKTMQLIEKLEEQRENALSMLYKVKDLVLSAHAEMGELRSQVQEMLMRLEEKSILSLRLGEEQKRSEKEVEELQVRLGEEQKKFEKEVEELQVQLEMHKEELERAQMQLKTERASIEEWVEVADSLQAAIDITNERMSDLTNMLHVKEVEAVQLQKEVQDLKEALTKHQTTIRISASTLETEQGRAAELERKLGETLREKEGIIASTKERAEKLENQLLSSKMAAFREVEAAGFLIEELTAERERMREKEQLFAECNQNWKSGKEKELGLLEKKVIESQTKMNDLAKELTWERKERLRIESEFADKSKQLCDERDVLAKEVAEQRHKFMSLGSNMRLALSSGLEDALHLSMCKSELKRKQEYESDLENRNRQLSEKRDALVKRVAEEKQKVVSLKAHMGFTLSRGLEDALRLSLTETELRRLQEEQLAECSQNWKSEKEKEIGLLEKKVIESQTKMNDLAKELTWERKERLRIESEFAERSKQLCEERDVLAKEVAKELTWERKERLRIESEFADRSKQLCEERDVQAKEVAKELTWERKERLRIESEFADRSKQLCKERDVLAKEVAEQRQKFMSLGSNMRLALSSGLGNALHLSICLAELKRKQEYESDLENRNRQLSEKRDALVKRVAEEKQKVVSLKAHMGFTLSRGLEDALRLSLAETELRRLQEEQLAECSQNWKSEKEKELLGRSKQGMEEVVRLTNEKEVMRRKVDELEGRLKELEWCETVAYRNAEALLVKETEMEQKLKKAEEGNKRLEDELLAKEVEMGQRCSMLMQALESEREKKESQNLTLVIDDVKRDMEMKEQEIRRYLQLLQEAEEQIAAMKEEVRQLRMSNVTSERNDYQGGGLEEHIVRADEFRELREVNKRLELELKDMVAQKEAEESARLSLEERATYAGQKLVKFEEEVKFLAERLNFAVNAKQETERQLTEKEKLSTELRQELDAMIQWKQQNERTLTHLRERLELEQQVSLKKEEELKRLRSEIVKWKDEIVKYEDEIVKYTDDLVKCKDEIVTCRGETIKCMDEAAKWKTEAKISKQKIVEVGRNMREAEESWNRKEEDGRRKTSELELMVKKLEEEVKLRRVEVSKKEEELEAVEREIAGCLEYLANWAKRVPDGSTHGKARINEESTEVNENIKANGDNGQQGPKSGANSLKVESEGEKRSQKGMESTARIQLLTLREILKEIKKLIMGKLSALEKQCVKQRRQLQLFHSNYQKSEAEVELLHKDVETLDIILAETDMRLTSYSGVLKHFPGMPDFIAKVKAVAASRFLDGPRPRN